MPETPVLESRSTGREGQLVPDVTFRLRRNGDWATVTSDDIFAGKNVVVFSLPGAFTPTCSSTHLPRFNELAPVFRDQGIDAIVCISVNDPFVMEEWGRDQEADNIFLLPDGNGEFTAEMGMLVDKSDLNFGKRSWRYSMLVRDGKIEKIFSEPQEPGDPFKVSDADTMLKYLNPRARMPDQVAILTREGCAILREGQAPADGSRVQLCGSPAAAFDPDQGAGRDRRRRAPCRRSSSTAG